MVEKLTTKGKTERFIVKRYGMLKINGKKIYVIKDQYSQREYAYLPDRDNAELLCKQLNVANNAKD